METGIGKRIKAKRLEIGISQGELASRLGLKSKSTICKIEKGDDNLTTDSVKKYAEALGCSIPYLMGRDDTEVEAEHEARSKEFIKLFENVDPVVQESIVNLLKSSQLKS